MKKSIYLLSIGLISMAASENANAPQQVVSGNNRFAEDYWKSKTDEKNYFISPLSISTAMAMTYAGAKGKTAEEFEKVLHYNNSAGDFHQSFGALQSELEQNMADIEWNLANRLWGYKGPFEPSFLKLNQEVYHAPIQMGASESTINAWVEKQTKGKIKDLVPPGAVTVDTRMILTNAVYFKADWKYAFKEKNTKKKPFYTKSNGEVKVDMMYQKGGFAYSRTNNFQILKLPYKGDKQSMVIFLPNEEANVDLNSITLEDLQRAKHMNMMNVKVYLPKFKLEYTEVMNNYLIKKGMGGAFGGGADFSGIMTTEPIWIDAVIHKAFVEVSEKGTEAAAATAVIMTTESTIGPPPEPIFNANRPFSFFIMDDVSGSILFMGKMENPAE